MKNWKKLFQDNFYLVLLIGIILFFFYPTLLFRKIPIPGDTIVGMYHPWRDVIWDNLTAGVPYKNFLITDPVRQQYVWRKLAIEEFQKGNLPLWNPYSFSGTPLLANFQTGSFYPLGILFFILPFNFAWTILVILQPLLAGVFLYLYLRNMQVSKAGSFLGGITFAFSGFSIAWLEWNTIGHVILWLPLTLLSIEKIILGSRTPPGGVRLHKKIIWSLIFIFSITSSFFAGHLQIFFYSFVISIIYLSLKIITLNQNKSKTILLFVICFILFILVTSIQWLPTIQFILNSARSFDQGSWLKEGWFIPWQNLIQFLAPDFFGNPATGNYWGVWNYGEFIGFIGIVPLIFSLYALIFRRDKKILFFGCLLFLSILFAFPVGLAKLPYILNIPFISTSQPTRLMFVIDFSLSILAALGFDWFLRNLKDRNNQKRLAGITLLFFLIISIFWLFVLNPSWIKSISPDNILIAKRNLIFPTITVVFISVIFLSLFRLEKNKHFTTLLYSIVVMVTVVDLFRFGWKFTPFSPEEWIFPQTKLLDYLSQKTDNYRVMAMDRRIMPPNFSAFYKLGDVSGYDPLYLTTYSQLAAAWERNKPDISPASFNRIITPDKPESFLTDLLGIKYILSLSPLKSDKLEYISNEGNTYLYANRKVFPRVFLVENVIKVESIQEEMDKIFELNSNLKSSAVSREDVNVIPTKLQATETAEIISYSPSQVIIAANTSGNRLMVFTDIYYPTWRVFIDKIPTKMYKVDFSFRGVLVPSGKHIIEFKDNLL